MIKPGGPDGNVNCLQLTGRELDARIAEMMGWRWFHHLKINALYFPGVDPGYPWKEGFIKGDKREHLDGCYYYNSSRGGETIPQFPHFSTNIAAAWEVVEKMDKLRKWRRGTMLVFDGTWEVGFYNDDWDTGPRTWDEKVYADANTAPLAICLAALKAVDAPDPS